jgi:hypothetical protein
MRPHKVLPTLVAAALLAATGCGGDDGDDGESNGGADATPAETILADAGLDICGDAQQQIAQSTISEGATAVRSFAVAQDCGGKETSSDVIAVFQFADPDERDRAAAAAGTAFPGSVVMTSGALVIVTMGPNSDANADAVGQAYADETGAPVATTG